MMAAHHIAAAALLALGILIEMICCLGVVLMRRASDRLHYLGPAAFLGPLLIALALIVDKSSLQSCMKAVLIWMGLTVIGPIVTHAVGRAVLADEGAILPEAG